MSFEPDLWLKKVSEPNFGSARASTHLRSFRVISSDHQNMIHITYIQLYIIYDSTNPLFFIDFIVSKYYSSQTIRSFQNNFYNWIQIYNTFWIRLDKVKKIFNLKTWIITNIYLIIFFFVSFIPYKIIRNSFTPIYLTLN